METGKKVIFIETDVGILLKPLSREMRKLRGILGPVSLEQIEKEISDLRKNWRLE